MDFLFPVDHDNLGHHSLTADLLMNSYFLKALEGLKDSGGNTRVIVVEEGDDIKSKIENAPEGALIFICQGTYTFTDTINPPNGVHLLGANKHHTVLNFKPSTNDVSAFYWYNLDYRFAASNFTLQYDDSVAGPPDWHANGFYIRYVGGQNIFTFQLHDLIIKDFHSGICWAGSSSNYSSLLVFNVLTSGCSYAGFYGGSLHCLLLCVASKSCGTGINFSNQFASVVNNFTIVDCTTGVEVYSNAASTSYYIGSLFVNGNIVRPTTGIKLQTAGSGTDLRRLHAPRVTNVRINNCSGTMIKCAGYSALGYIDNIILENIEHTTGSEDGSSQVTPTYGLYIGQATEIHFAKVTGCDFSQASTPVYVEDPSITNWDDLEYKEVKV